MNKLARLSLVLLAPAALAAPDAPAPGEAEHPWSFGAGIGFSSFGSSGGAQLALATCCSTNSASYLLNPTIPGPVFGFERMLAPGTALVLSLSGNLSSSSSPLGDPAPFSTVTTGQSHAAVAAMLGLRTLLNQPGAPVLVSAVGGLGFSYSTAKQDQTQVDSTGARTASTASASAIAVGLRGGLSVDRLLTERLTLRLSAMLVSGSYLSTRSQASETAPSLSGNGFDLRLSVDPSLELRLSF